MAQHRSRDVLQAGALDARPTRTEGRFLDVERETHFETRQPHVANVRVAWTGSDVADTGVATVVSTAKTWIVPGYFTAP